MHESGAAITVLHHGAKNADNIYRGSTSLGSEVDILVGMAASPINANARVLSPVGRVEGLGGFVVVYDKQTHEWAPHAAGARSIRRAGRRTQRDSPTGSLEESEDDARHHAITTLHCLRGQTTR
jgi:hypothetical protein